MSRQLSGQKSVGKPGERGLGIATGWIPRVPASRFAVAVLLTLCSLVVYSGCEAKRSTDGEATANKLHQRVAVTNYPLYCMVSSICRDPGGPVQEVIYVGPPQGSDSHSWMPSTAQIRDLQKVDLIICNGPGAVFANWMDKVTIDESKLGTTTDAIKLEEFVVVKDYQLVHSHGPEGEHSHSWVVAHSWLSPKIARRQAKLCHERLVSTYGDSSQLANGFAELQKKFDVLESAHEKIMTDHSDIVVASSTPEIQYLTRSLGWSDRYLQWTEPRDEAQAKSELEAMRSRVGGKDNEEAVVANETLFLWSGDAIEELAPLVKSNWPKNATIDLIETPESDDSDFDGYFKRMSANLERIGDLFD
ncbi:metal ABC transporter substrate-binding protein [Mariniblastus fucicola]|uniref:metal ABC transporter substrate-binding protein n=1 Tax=Mariniblastus fucicola TaxID=980251 RepID=UPI001EE4A960|nr:metal ABC transporter substrate-binding protein [Mariniblastus fucicola]